MKIIGLIAEYNPFHNGHLYQINKIKELYPNSTIILILNGYFLERGQISIESKEEKTRLALKYGIDLVIELPFIFGSNSADIFAEAAIDLLSMLHVNTLVFGSESNDIELLNMAARRQLEKEFDSKLKEFLDQGLNYPTALNKAIGIDIKSPNDLLGISYIKAIKKNNYNIIPVTIKRTNDYHDTISDELIISATNIREKISNGVDVTDYIPEGKINSIDNDLLFKLLKYRIVTDDISIYLTVDEGIENRLKKEINKVNSIEELIEKVKTKRYTYNRIMRMFIHILVGLKKSDKDNISKNEYIRILGFNDKGSKYLNSIKKTVDTPIVTKFTNVSSVIKDYEIKAATIYMLLTNDNVLLFEYSNKPIKELN